MAIKVCSYNVFWKIMDLDNSPYVKAWPSAKLLTHRSNVLENILLVKKHEMRLFLI